MRQSQMLDEISGRIREILAASPAKDVEKNMRAMLAGAFSRLDLVNREEFDAQAKVLARTRVKLEELRERVAELDSRLRQQR